MSAVVDQTEAQARAERIREKSTAVADWLADIRHAYAARDWETLGYDTWQEYLDGEFGEHRIQLPREERRHVVDVMARAGMSTRAIAAATGASQKTVDRDIRSSESDDSDEPRTRVQSLDGRSRPATHTATPAAGSESTPQPESRPATDDGGPPSPEPTPQPAPPSPAPAQRRAPRRAPLVETASAAGWNLRKQINDIEELLHDNRFPQNREQVAAALRSHLLHAAETATTALGVLANADQSSDREATS